MLCSACGASCSHWWPVIPPAGATPRDHKKCGFVFRLVRRECRGQMLGAYGNGPNPRRKQNLVWPLVAIRYRRGRPFLPFVGRSRGRQCPRAKFSQIFSLTPLMQRSQPRGAPTRAAYAVCHRAFHTIILLKLWRVKPLAPSSVSPQQSCPSRHPSATAIWLSAVVMPSEPMPTPPCSPLLSRRETGLSPHLAQKGL